MQTRKKELLFLQKEFYKISTQNNVEAPLSRHKKHIVHLHTPKSSYKKIIYKFSMCSTHKNK